MRNTTIKENKVRIAEQTAKPASRATVALAVLAACAALLALLAGPAQAAPTTICSTGSGAGQCEFPKSVAVDQSDGTTYVADANNQRIDAFDQTGAFLRAFGFGVLDGAEELQVCTALCIGGLQGTAPGQVEPASLALDPVSHDIYAYDARNSRVEKYTPAGEFLLMFGKDVDTTPGTLHPDLCTAANLEAGDTCGAGSQGTGPGQFSGSLHPIALDSAGDVWVGDVNRIEQFSPAGQFLSEVALPVAGAPESLAIDSAGNFYSATAHNEVPAQRVEKLGPSGELLYTVDDGGAPTAVVLDPQGGELFVGDCLREPSINFACSSPYALLAYDSTGVQTRDFGRGEVIGTPRGGALGFDAQSKRLYVASSEGGAESAVLGFGLPAPGPRVETGTSEALEIHFTSATLKAKVNPEGRETTYHFDYVDQQSFEAEGGFASPHIVTSAESAPIGPDFEAHDASFEIASGQLKPATTYRFRVIATNECEPVTNPGHQCVATGETASFETTAPAAIDSTAVTAVTATSATLEAQINPLGNATTYRFQYITEAAYLENEAAARPLFEGAASAPSGDVSIGAGSEGVAVSQHLQGLAPHTAYRYRVVIRNAISEANGGPFAGPTQSFSTQPAASSFLLPDGRAWELVSPPDKHGGVLLPISKEILIQASANGDALTYRSTSPTEAELPGTVGGVQVLSTRAPAGWDSLDIALAHELPTGQAVGPGPEFRFASEDLSGAILQPFGSFVPSISPEASEQTPFLRVNFAPGDPAAPCQSSCYRPLVTAAPGFANVAEGTEFGEEGACPPQFLCGPRFVAATPDLSQVVLGSKAPLLAGAPEQSLYMWSAGKPPAEALRLLSVLPAGQALPDAQLALQGSRNAISADGSRVAFVEDPGSSLHHLYLRDLGKGETVQLDAVHGGPGASQPASSQFQIASTDASRVFFTDAQQLTADSGANPSSGLKDLYECRLEEVAGVLHCELTDLTPKDPEGESAAVQGGVLGASADGSYLYFVADGVLSGTETNQHGERAQSGQPNLYLRHGGQTRFLAVLSGGDAPDWKGELAGQTARVSPDGHRLAFMSQRPLTGYDSRDAVSDQLDEEVYLYSAEANSGEGGLVCASCNPTGARPHGIEYSKLNAGLVGGINVWPGETWLAANIPSWTTFEDGHSLHQSRYLSNSGRLFFNAADALVPQDTNGNEDVYQYEPLGLGSCAATDPTYAPAAGGCTDLISSGTSSSESAFLDASESGDDVFFLTSSRLVSQDFDTARDVYDAHVCSAELPCPPPAPLPEPPCEGDACQLPATPPAHPTPGSSLLDGPGNVLQCPKGKVKKKGKCVAKKAKKKTHKKNAKKRTAHTTRRASR